MCGLVGMGMLMTYSLRNTEFSMAHQEPSDLLQHRMVSLLDIKSVRIGLLRKAKLMAGILNFCANRDY